LEGVGLNDSRCRVIAEYKVPDLSLQSSPDIGQKGYTALVGLLNRNYGVRQILEDDDGWQDTSDLIIEMNKHGRGDFLCGGAFASIVNWVDWLTYLVTRSPQMEEDCSESFQLDCLMYVLEKPDYIS
jgi:hypothetical protein